MIVQKRYMRCAMQHICITRVDNELQSKQYTDSRKNGREVIGR